MSESDELYQITAEWHVKRTERLLLEREFLHYTGGLDIVELHVPYTKYDYFDRVLERAKRYKTKMERKRILVCAGDNMNLDIFGPFFRQPTSESTIQASVRKEIDTLMRLLQKAEKIYDRIIFLQTNHDKRIYKVLYRALQDKKQAEEMAHMIKPIKEFMEERGLKKIVHTPGIIFCIGDVAIVHFQNNLSVPGSLSRKICKGIINRLPPKIKVVYIAHSHYQSRFPIFRKLMIEMGALCDIFDYARGEKLWGEEKTITIGYAYGELDDGIANWNGCNYYIFELEGYM